MHFLPHLHFHDRVYMYPPFPAGISVPALMWLMSCVVCVCMCGLMWWFLEAGYSSCLWFLSFSPLLLPVHRGLQPFDNTHLSHITNKGSTAGLTNQINGLCVEADKFTERLTDCALRCNYFNFSSLFTLLEVGFNSYRVG